MEESIKEEVINSSLTKIISSVMYVEQLWNLNHVLPPKCESLKMKTQKLQYFTLESTHVMLENHVNHCQKSLKSLLVMETSQLQRQQKTQLLIVFKKKHHPGKIFTT